MYIILFPCILFNFMTFYFIIFYSDVLFSRGAKEAGDMPTSCVILLRIASILTYVKLTRTASGVVRISRNPASPNTGAIKAKIEIRVGYANEYRLDIYPGNLAILR